MKIDIGKIFKKELKNGMPSCIDYCHTHEYTRYMKDPVSVEKKILTTRGLDEFNIGHTPRSYEIEEFIDRELRDAAKQLSDHLEEYRSAFEKRLSDAEAKKAEVEVLQNDLAVLQRNILNLESRLEKEGMKS